MAKVTKKMLKSVVKECLVEILSEGLGEEQTLTESKNVRRKSKSIFDQMDESFEKRPHPSDNVSFGNRVSAIASAATSDPLLQSILEDTAKTTLQDQMQHESSIPTVTNMGASHSSPAPTGGEGAGLDINSLFGEATKNWSELMERTERKPL